MAIKYPDYLLPINNKNRNEYFITEFDTIIKSINEAIIIYIINNPNKYKNIFPLAFEEDSFKSKIDLYNFSILFDIKDIFKILSDDKDFNIKNNINDIIKDIRSKYSYTDTINTRFAYALQNILSMDICKELIIVDKYANEDNELQKVIIDLFSFFINKKIKLINGNIEDVIENEKQATTIILSSSSILFNMKNIELIKNKYFQINILNSINKDLIKSKNIVNLSLSLLNKDELELFEKNNNCKIDFFYPYEI